MFTPQNQLFVTDLVLFLQNFDVFFPINTARKNSQKTGYYFHFGNSLFIVLHF